MKTTILKEHDGIKLKMMKTAGLITESEYREMSEELGEEEMGDQLDESLLQDPNFVGGVATLATLGGTFLVSLMKDLKKAKSEGDKKNILKKIAGVINKHAGNY
jgi:hypothetical protein